MEEKILTYKVCPGCKGKDLSAETGGPANNDPIWIHCEKCGFDGPGSKEGVEAAIKKWNKRCVKTPSFKMEKLSCYF